MNDSELTKYKYNDLGFFWEPYVESKAVRYAKHALEMQKLTENGTKRFWQWIV